jgi:RimJ/RimL family protein N-acetyltransferase
MLDIFIEGEIVDLCIPTETFAGGDIWYSWFNDSHITRYISQGAFPNTPELQKTFFNSIGADRIVLIIQTKAGKQIGVISLSAIDHARKACEFALVVDTFADLKNSAIGSLESAALMCSHGFNVVGMRRITALQHSGLLSWQQRLELLGFKIEGLHSKKFVKGSQVADGVSLALDEDDFKKLCLLRNGSLWDGSEKMMVRISKLPKKSFRSELDDFFVSNRAEYYKNLFGIDS